MGDGEHCTASERILRQNLRQAAKISFFFSHLVKLIIGTSFRYKVLHFDFVWINMLLIVIRDLVNVDTKRSYLCLTQTFIVLWIA